MSPEWAGDWAQTKKTTRVKKCFYTPRRPDCVGVRGCFSFRSMGQVTGVWPTLTDSPERKKLASSKNLGFVMFCTTRPLSHPKMRGESLGDFVSFTPWSFHHTLLIRGWGRKGSELIEKVGCAGGLRVGRRGRKCQPLIRRGVVTRKLDNTSCS